MQLGEITRQTACYIAVINNFLKFLNIMSEFYNKVLQKGEDYEQLSKMRQSGGASQPDFNM